MTTSAHDPAFDAPPASPAALRAEAASDLRGGLGWTLFGGAVLIGSLRMDRLEAQHINPYTVPGLLPALLGIVMVLLGVLLVVRSWRRGARFTGGPRLAMDGATLRRLGVVIGLIVVYTIVLLGHGLPFWVGSSLYVAASIVLLQAPQRAAAGKRLGWRELAFAAVVGLGTGAVITFVFQELFLVRLP